jgi:predicted DNA-binding protein (UPF0251 family)
MPGHGQRPFRKLKFQVAETIRRASKAGETQTALAAKHGVSQVTVWRIIHGKRYNKD